MNCHDPYWRCDRLSCLHLDDTYLLQIRRDHDKNHQHKSVWIANLGNEEFDESVEFM